MILNSFSQTYIQTHTCTHKSKGYNLKNKYNCFCQDTLSQQQEKVDVGEGCEIQLYIVPQVWL